VQEPQPALGKGERDARWPRPWLQGEAGGAGLAQPRGELGDGGGLEQQADRQLAAEAGADPADQPGGQQRVAAEVEEAVVEADLIEAEGLGEQAGEDLLLRGPRGPAAGRGEVRGGQGAAVELAVRRQRQGLEHHHRRRHQVLGQKRGEVAAQGARLRGGAGGSHDIADQLRVALAVGTGDHRRLGDVGMLGQGGLDLAGLDAEAADLDLLVGPAEEVEHPVGTPAGEVAAAVHAAAGRTEGIGDKALGRQARPPQVAARQPLPRQCRARLPPHRTGCSAASRT
jgi:hypothetical protein